MSNSPEPAPPRIGPGSAAPAERVDVNYLFRGKIHFFAAQNAHFSQQLQLSDAKSATLATLAGLLLVNVLQRADAIDAYLILFSILMAASIAFALWSVAPRVPPAEARSKILDCDKFSWPGLSAADFDSVADFAERADAEDLACSLARCNAALARILLAKFQRLRLAFLCGGLAVATFLAKTLVMLSGAG